MVAEILQKSKYLLCVLNSCYMKFHYICVMYLYVYYVFKLCYVSIFTLFDFKFV